MPKYETYSDRLLLEQLKSHKEMLEDLEKNEGSQDAIAETKGWIEVLQAEKERRKIK